MLLPQLLAGSRGVGSHRLTNRWELSQALAEHAAAADLLLGWRGILQLETWRAAQLPGSFLDHHAEALAQQPGIGQGQLPGRADAHASQVLRHLPADTPHLAHI